MSDKPQQATERGGLGPRIVVVGVGGAGGNAINNMIQAKLLGVDFLVANTDAQALGMSLCERRIQIGRDLTQGLGAGSRPDIGREAAEEALAEIHEAIAGANMVFITAGMGGGTGTGAAPVIARAAREAGILTVGVVTKPFQFEGGRRMSLADLGIEELADQVDTLIVIPNQNLFRVANEKTTFADAFRMADEVLHSGVRGVTDLMVTPGLINLDFADVRAVMTEMGKAMMGTGEAEGENRALVAAEAAISNPLLDEISMKGARGVLINVTGGMDLTLFEIDQAANRIRDEVDGDANIIFGSTLDERLQGRMRVSVVAAGIDVGPAARTDAISKRPIVSLFASRMAAQPKDGDERPKASAAVGSAREREARPPIDEEVGATPSGDDGGGRDAPSRTSAPVFPFRARAKERKGAESSVGPDRALKSTPAAGQGGPSQSASPQSMIEDEPETGVESELAREEPEAAPETRPEEEPVDGPAASDAAAQPEGDAVAEAGRAPEARSVPNATPPSGAPDEARAARDSETDVAVPRRRRPGGFLSWISGTAGENADELFRKADRLYHGQGERRNLPLAFRAYMRAAEMEHAGAQNRVGWMYEKGEGVEADHGEALRWYRKAAEQGYVNAMNDLGYMYRQGWGVPQSYEDALYWFGKAAAKYDSYAEYNMGQMYENGWGVKQDVDEAIRWFRRSAARGHEWSAKRLEELGIKT